VHAESAEHAVPIERRAAGAQHVHDVGAVEPLALHDERLLPQKLLAGHDLDRHPEHLRLDGVVEPAVVHGTRPVSRVEDEVDEVIVPPRLPSQCGKVSSVR
jgi:hypothetical protein